MMSRNCLQTIYGSHKYPKSFGKGAEGGPTEVSFWDTTNGRSIKTIFTYESLTMHPTESNENYCQL